jgi:hypothetical protein
MSGVANVRGVVVNRFSIAALLVAALLPSVAIGQSQSGPGQPVSSPPADARPGEYRQVPAGSAGAGGPVESQVLKPSDFENSGKPEVPKFQRGSSTRAGGPANELNTNDGRKSQELPGGSVANALSGTDLYHGNHCGTGTRGANLAPTDELDATCQRHDQCYEKAGRRSCACDRQLRQEALTVSTTARLSRELRARALSVSQAAELMECQEP